MTAVTIEKNSLGRNIRLMGHAGRNKEGSIVCAAVSMLAQTIAQYLYDAECEGETDLIDISLKSGNAYISYITDEERVNDGVDAIATGFTLLSDNYPEMVSIDIYERR